MNELLITYGPSKTKRIVNILIGTYLSLFCSYFCISEGVANRFATSLFICSLIGLTFALVLLLSYTLWLPSPVVKIDVNIIDTKIPKQHNTKVEWATVSKVNMGVSYIVFFVNGGQKQQKIDLSDLLYKDVKDVKSKIVEICEYKNIPYQND